MLSKTGLSEAYDRVLPSERAADTGPARIKEVTTAVNKWIYKISRAAVSTLHEFNEKTAEQNASSRNADSTPKKRLKPSPKLQEVLLSCYEKEKLIRKLTDDLEASRSGQKVGEESEELQKQLKEKDAELQRTADEGAKCMQSMEKEREQICQQLVRALSHFFVMSIVSLCKALAVLKLKSSGCEALSNNVRALAEAFSNFTERCSREREGLRGGDAGAEKSAGKLLRKLLGICCCCILH